MNLERRGGERINMPQWKASYIRSKRKKDQRKTNLKPRLTRKIKALCCHLIPCTYLRRVEAATGHTIVSQVEMSRLRASLNHMHLCS